MDVANALRIIPWVLGCGISADVGRAGADEDCSADRSVDGAHLPAVLDEGGSWILIHENEVKTHAVTGRAQDDEGGGGGDSTEVVLICGLP